MWWIKDITKIIGSIINSFETIWMYYIIDRVCKAMTDQR